MTGLLIAILASCFLLQTVSMLRFRTLVGASNTVKPLLHKEFSTWFGKRSLDFFTTDMFYVDGSWNPALKWEEVCPGRIDKDNMKYQVKIALGEIVEEHAMRRMVNQDRVVYVGDEVMRAADLLSILGVPFARDASGDLDLKIGVGLGKVMQQEGGIFSERSWMAWRDVTAFRVRRTVGDEKTAAEILKELE